MEHWAAITGFENYEVSDQGRVRDVTTGNILDINYTRGGNESWFGQVILIRNGKQCKRLVNRLVAIAFCQGYFLGLEVDHKDGDKENCAASNLNWVPYSENIEQAYRTGWIKKTNHDKRKRVRIIEIEKDFASLTACAEYLEVSRAAICNQLKGRVPHVKGFTFRYI